MQELTRLVAGCYLVVHVISSGDGTGGGSKVLVLSFLDTNMPKNRVE